MRTHHHKIRSLSSYALLLGILSISACQSGHELHFFKYGNNYYRLKIKEKSFASKSRYMSGFYDDKAVDRYFSEFSQPKESAAKKNDEVTFINPVTGTDKTCNCPADSNRKLVMILSTNSDAVSEQIGAFAENDQILESIARLSNKDKIEGTKKFESQMREGNTRNQSLITLGDQYIQSLAADTKSDVIRSTMIGYLQNLQVISSSNQNKTNIEILLSSFQK